MKTLRLSAMLCIALLSAMHVGCGIDIGPGRDESEIESVSTGYVYVLNGKKIDALDYHAHIEQRTLDEAKTDFVYGTNVILNQEYRWNTPYYREYRDGEFWIHGNNCPNGWRNYWQPFYPQAIKWLDLRAEVWEKERYPWRVAEGWTMDNKMRDDKGRRYHIHCSTPRRTQ